MSMEVLVPLLEQIQRNVLELDQKFEALASTHVGDRECLSVAEAADLLNRKPFTVREWCRNGRVLAEKALSGRGCSKEWRISREEIDRILNEGLLPPH